MSNFESMLTQLTAQRDRLGRDVGTELLSQLTADEQHALDAVTREIQNLKDRAKDLCKERSKVQNSVFCFYSSTVFNS